MVGPARKPRSRSACRTQHRNVFHVQPNFVAIDAIAAHCEPYSAWCSSTIYIAHSHILDEYRFSVVMPNPLKGWSPRDSRDGSDRRSRMILTNHLLSVHSLRVDVPNAGLDCMHQSIGYTGSRLSGLDPAAIQHVIDAAQSLDLGRVIEAEAHLQKVLPLHPTQPEVLRLYAGVLSLRGNHAAALGNMQHALQLRPRDPLYFNTLGTVLAASGDLDGAIRALHDACEIEPAQATAWFNLGVLLTRCVRHDEASAALQRAVQLAPGNMAARALLGDMLRTRGRTDEAAAEYRKVLSECPWAGMAWWGLADLRTGAFETGDIERMRAALVNPRASEDDRIATGFALASALDGMERYKDSLAALRAAHAIARRRMHWDAHAFSSKVREIQTASSPPRLTVPDNGLGQGVVFIVGLPRSGTTLVEQILASHSAVEGAGELPDLPAVLTAESQRRNKPFPDWIANATISDWQRLGERYLERTAFWHRRHPVFTDKLPINWMYTGMIRAMLPRARIVICRRAPLESCFSCYRQHLVGNEYSRTFEDLAAFWHDFDDSANRWTRLYPSHVHQHSYESLLANHEGVIRELLAFCGLPFEEVCLRFHQTRREVRSPSATQVRQPLQANTARAERYGDLLDPLRISLGLPLGGS